MPITGSVRMLDSLAPPCIGPHNDASPAATQANKFAPEEPVLNPVIEQAMNQILVLHADHGQCASTTTVRAAGSSGANACGSRFA
jgi:citrate synthase